MLTEQDFLLERPEVGKINLLLSDPEGAYMVYGVSTLTVDGQGNDLLPTLQECSDVIFSIDGGYYRHKVIEKRGIPHPSGSFFYLSVDPESALPSSSTFQYNNVEVIFSPKIREQYIFSDYNPIINNVSESRQNKNILVVDRDSSQGDPLNLKGVLNLTAASASIPDSNYTKRGLATSRYEGTKLTTVRTIPDLNKQAFETSFFISVSEQYNVRTFNSSVVPNMYYTGDEPFKSLMQIQGTIQPYYSDAQAMKDSLLSSTELVSIYFEPEITSGSLQDVPSVGSTMYYEVDGRLAKLPSVKILSIDTGKVYKVNDQGKVEEES